MLNHECGHVEEEEIRLYRGHESEEDHDPRRFYPTTPLAHAVRVGYEVENDRGRRQYQHRVFAEQQREKGCLTKRKGVAFNVSARLVGTFHDYRPFIQT